MTTYTIALIGDMLAATAVDGDSEMMAERLDETLSQIEPGSESEVRYVSGLTLFATEEEADEAGAYIEYTGTDMGWLQDEAGEMKYFAAGRLPA